MFIFAHIFAGALLGLLFWQLANDRRAVPLCIIGSVLPDLFDKPLGLLFPSVLGGGRTVFHALIIVAIILLCTLVFVRSRWLGAGVAGGVLLHQVLDEMWNLPANWFYPLLGPFQGHMIPDYIGTFFWFEITNPSEWLFMIGSVVILARTYHYLPPISFIDRSDRLKTGVRLYCAAVFIVTGPNLVITGFTSSPASLIVPQYAMVPAVFAGVLALCGGIVMSRKHWT
jgi:hypothetical protein